MREARRHRPAGSPAVSPKDNPTVGGAQLWTPSRRGLLGAAGASLAGMALAACAQDTPAAVTGAAGTSSSPGS